MLLLQQSWTMIPTCCITYLLLFVSVVNILEAVAVQSITATSFIIDPDLPLGDINIFVVTDTHSWCGGQKKLYGDTVAANYGDVLSFVQRMKQYIYNNDEQLRRDVWFVMNGDIVDGTGLSMNGNIKALLPILERMQYDAINVGNHELYSNHFILEQLTSPGGFVEWYDEKYISSNVRFNTTGASSDTPLQDDDENQPIGSRFRVLKGKFYNVLTFGFLYNMKNYASSVMVDEVETTVQQSWFIDAIQQKSDQYDAILILAHMDVRDPLCQIILDAIRSISGNDNIPVQFITGHTHVRDYHIFDPQSTSFEAGHFLDTLGFVSFPAIETVLNVSSQIVTNVESTMNRTTTDELSITSTASLFKYKYIDADINVFASTLGVTVEAFQTSDGMEQSHFIARIQKELGLNDIIGCSDGTYYLNRSLNADDSLWGYFRDNVLPPKFSGKTVVFLGSGGWRYDLYFGTVSVDDVYGISPYNNTFWSWINIPADVIVVLNNTLNALPSQFPTPLPNFVLMPMESSFYIDENYTLIVDSYTVPIVEGALRDIFVPKYGNDVPIPEQLLSETTTTSIWVDYFRETANKCEHSKHNTPANHESTKPSSTHNGVKQHDYDSSTDTVRLLFVAIAVVIVAIFGSIILYQNQTIFHYIKEQRDRATMEAIREYEEQEGDDDVDNDDNEEGEFT